MKTLSDFKIPFSWEERRTILLEKCLYIPAAFEAHEGPLDLSAAFETPQPIAVEYCSGNGHWILTQAERRKEINWIAVEKDFERARKTWLKIVRSPLKNIFLVCGEALTFTSHYLPAASVLETYVNFPDPWPKRRHHKNRLVQKPFVDEMARIAAPGFSAMVVTDDAEYSEQVIEMYASWKSAFGEKRFVTEWPDYGHSTFYELWNEKKRTIRYHRFLP